MIRTIDITTRKKDVLVSVVRDGNVIQAESVANLTDAILVAAAVIEVVGRAGSLIAGVTLDGKSLV